jgi:hypothetical protein
LNETKMCEVKPDEDNMMSRSCSNDNDNTWVFTHIPKVIEIKKRQSN